MINGFFFLLQNYRIILFNSLILCLYLPPISFLSALLWNIKFSFATSDTT